MSTLSTSSAGSATQQPILEARVVTITPAHTQDTSTLGQLDAHTLARTDSVRSIDQPTPPLSPNSVEFYVRPPSVPSVTNSRLIMAVTKQEEMLLSALRMKRARMRGNALSELEEEEEAFGETLSRQSSVRTRDTAYMAPVRAIQKSGSKSSIGTSLSRSQSRTGPWSDTEESHDVTLGSEFAPADAPQDRIVFYLDQGVGQAEDEEEPSPDLSDFMDYDDGSEDAHSLRETDSLRRDNDKPPATPKDAVPSTASLDSKEHEGTDELCLAGEEDVGYEAAFDIVL
ncbi:unnamed protein product [Parascedosporium putredinis]|uniref:Uncharacterized protein n=1 Tax=Parascedosporium putredinis TaxID=1442378 RepID=A0A9P1H7N3_9PEZI|nr:unnamed protein product [Parascedosporium putredinis]CAI7999879.1 unnamed protein product [Parascedosporium putredinis]